MGSLDLPLWTRIRAMNLVAADVRRRNAPHVINVRLVTSAATKVRFMGSLHGSSTAH
jgi:hypothetical protein